MNIKLPESLNLGDLLDDMMGEQSRDSTFAAITHPPAAPRPPPEVRVTVSASASMSAISNSLIVASMLDRTKLQDHQLPKAKPKHCGGSFVELRAINSATDGLLVPVHAIRRRFLLLCGCFCAVSGSADEVLVLQQ